MDKFYELTIDKSNGNVCYNDKYHIYWDRKDMFTYISATTLIGLFDSFDKDFWLGYKSVQSFLPKCNKTERLLKNLRKVRVLDINEVMEAFPGAFTLQEWEAKKKELEAEWKKKADTACEFGTAAHASYENKFNEKGWYSLGWYGQNPDDHFAYIPNYYQFNDKLDRQVIPEMLISIKTDSGVRIAGQVDLCIKNLDYITVMDYKSNNQLDFVSYRYPDGRYEMMKYPLDMMMDCNIVHYQLQTSLYTWMLLKKYPLCKPCNPVIMHFYDKSDISKVERHELPFIPKKIILMLRYFRDHINYNYKKVIEKDGRFFIARDA